MKTLAPYLHHLTVHFPIVLSFVLSGVGLYALATTDWEDVPEVLDPVLRLGGWLAAAAATAAVVTGIVAAPGWFGGDDTVGLRHHRDLALTAWCIFLLAAYAYEKALGGGHPDWKKFAVGCWCVATFGIVGAAHWGGSELHTDLVPWLEETPEQNLENEEKPVE